MISMCKSLSERTGAIVVLTGAIDVVATSDKANVIYNGNPLMSKVTGTGCMLSAVTGAYCGANKEDLFEATTLAVAHMGLAGEVAFEKLEKVNGGTSTYKMLLIDAISQIDWDTLDQGIRIERS